MNCEKFTLSILFIAVKLFSCGKDDVEATHETEQLLTVEAIYKSLEGNWKVADSELLPFRHPSYCSEVKLNSIFQFAKDRSFKIINEGEKTNCNSDQSYSVLKDFRSNYDLTISEYDMLILYQIKKISVDSLIFKGRFYSPASQMTSPFNEGTFEGLKRNGFEVTLVKQ